MIKYGMIIVVIFITILISIMVFMSYMESNQPDVSDFSNEENSSPKIVFLDCSLTFDSVRQEYNMSLVSKKIVEGKMKSETINMEQQDKESFSYRIMNQKSQLISQTDLSWPLDRNIEYVDDQGYLQRKDIHLDSANVFLRFQLMPEMYYLAFYKQDRQLIIIDLKK